jgi:Uma2 family endonuclease
MGSPTLHIPDDAIVYPESDGLPMAENTRQMRWIFLFVGNLRILFRHRDDVFVAGDQNWYPVQGEPGVCQAPDAYVVFGRPKGERGSYKQWEEGGVPMTVVFEVLSPSNDPLEMVDKLSFYEEHGVEEYYVYDPDHNRLVGYARRGELLLRVRPMDGYVSPRLGIRFDLSGPELVVRYPDGRPFLSHEEMEEERVKALQQLDETRKQIDEARKQADEARRQAGAAEQRAARLAELTRKVLQQQATPEELQELQRLSQSSPRTGA